MGLIHNGMGHYGSGNSLSGTQWDKHNGTGTLWDLDTMGVGHRMTWTKWDTVGLGHRGTGTPWDWDAMEMAHNRTGTQWDRDTVDRPSTFSTISYHRQRWRQDRHLLEWHSLGHVMTFPARGWSVCRLPRAPRYHLGPTWSHGAV